jgi:hypothetical protein
MELKFTPFSIRKLEKAHSGTSFELLLQEGSFSRLTEFVSAGLHIYDEEAVDNAIMAYFDEGHSKDDLIFLILDALEASHFLQVGAAAMARKQVAEKMAELGLTSQSSGKQAK